MPALVNARFLVPVFLASPCPVPLPPDRTHAAQAKAMPVRAQVEAVSERWRPGPPGRRALTSPRRITSRGAGSARPTDGWLRTPQK